MGEVFGAVLPLAVGIAISPIPIIAAILMLLSARARVTSVGFLLGWLVGIVAAVTAFTLLSSVLPAQDPNASHPVVGVIQLVLGLLLLIMGIGQWRKRPREGQEPEMPKWMQAIDKINLPVSFGLGFLLSALNPKNLVLGVGAGVDIGTASLDPGTVTAVIAIFTVIAGSTVLVPVVGYLLAAEKLSGPLDALRGWLAKENAVIMTVLLVVIGVSMIGKGIGSF